jgi:hypothetical protein
MRFSVFLARVSWKTAPSGPTVPNLHGQVFWVARGIKTADPYHGLPPPITPTDRECASLRPPLAIFKATDGRQVFVTA